MAGIMIHERQGLILMEAISLLPEEYRDTHIPFRLKADKPREEVSIFDDEELINGVVHFCPRYAYQNPDVIIRLQIVHQKMIGNDNTRSLTKIKHHTIEFWESVQGLFNVPLGFDENREEVIKEIKSLSSSYKAVLERFEGWDKKQNPIDGEEGELGLVSRYVTENGMTTDIEWIKKFFFWIIANEGKIWAIPEGAKKV